MKEIEYRYLLKKDFNKEKLKEQSIKSIQDIKQAYLSAKLNIRVRLLVENSEEKAFLTYKKGVGVVRDEFECEISLDVAKELIKDAPILVEKKRYKYEYKGKIWDIDYYPEHNLWSAEIELESENESYQVLPFVLREVTGIKKYSNQKLGIKQN